MREERNRRQESASRTTTRVEAKEKDVKLTDSLSSLFESHGSCKTKRRDVRLGGLMAADRTEDVPESSIKRIAEDESERKTKVSPPRMKEGRDGPNRLTVEQRKLDQVHSKFLGDLPLCADLIQSSARSDSLSDGSKRSRRVEGCDSLLEKRDSTRRRKYQPHIQHPYLISDRFKGAKHVRPEHTAEEPTRPDEGREELPDAAAVDAEEAVDRTVLAAAAGRTDPAGEAAGRTAAAAEEAVRREREEVDRRLGIEEHRG